jgi:steroid 5-alpha reductase family enzyme
MFLVLIFEGYFIIDAVMNEPAILTTMDITTDGFGWMLSFGDLAWVPALYSLQARYLSSSHNSINSLNDLAFFAFVAILGVLGMVIFRGANSQKDQYKRDPNHSSVKSLPTIAPTQAGTKPLLVGGWWGMSRHINYLGDWLMSISWSLPCGFGSPLPYFYPI